MPSAITKGLSFLVLLLPVALSAQSIANITDQRVITETNGGPPDTVFHHTVSSRGRTRLDISAHGPLPIPWRTMGSTAITSMSDSGPVMFMVDSSTKTYWSLNLRSVLTGVFKSTGMTVKPASPGNGLSLDSIGAGDVVAGYRTVHFRSHTTNSMTMNLLGNPSTFTTATTADYYVAPGLRLDTLESAAASATKQRMRSVGDTLPKSVADSLFAGVPPSMITAATQAREAMSRMNKIGSAVKTVVESRITVDGGVKVTRTTTELVSHSTMAVPDSLFAIPAGYVSARPGFMPVR